jgi:hypothetical protein
MMFLILGMDIGSQEELSMIQFLARIMVGKEATHILGI